MIDNLSTPDPASLLQQATAALQAGRAAEARALCQQVLQTLPGQPDALQVMAMALAAQGDADGAEEHFRQSLSRAPRRADILVNFGHLLRRMDRRSDARSRFRKAVKVSPAFVPGWYNLGLVAREIGDVNEALRCARKVTELDPAYPPGWELLAAIEQGRERNDLAIEACRAGLKHLPEAPRLHYSLGQLLRQECDFTAAAEAYRRAEDCGFQSPDLYINRLEALSEAGDIEQAITCADSGLEKFPDSAALHRTRAHLHWEAGMEGDPVDPLRQAARSLPNDAALWYTLSRLLDRLGRRQDSIAAIEEARGAGCPETPELLMQEALCRAYAGRPGEATDLFNQLIQRFPEHKDARLTFAQHALTHGDPARAEQLCAEVLESHPIDQLAWCYRGTAWQLLEDEREHWLLDYERMVRPVPIPPPAGYADTIAFMRDAQEALETLHNTEAHPIEQSLRGGTQTNGFLFRLKHPILSVLEQQIRLAIGQVLADFPDEPQHPFWGRKIASPRGDGIRFSGAWSVRLRSEGYHTNHIHTEGWISSALYIALPDVVQAGGDTSGHIQFGVPMTELGLDLAPRRIIQPQVGSLALFPSYMWHGTIPFSSEQPRITVAFDLQPQP